MTYILESIERLSNINCCYYYNDLCLTSDFPVLIQGSVLVLALVLVV